jgi:hypothetical protein
MPLVYERAFGGADLNEDGSVRDVDARNPVGCGFSGNKNMAQMHGQALPNLEFPNQLIRDYRDRPAPACFAPVAPNWQPRVGFAGTYDHLWQEQRAPYLPEDYNPRFMNSAPADLIYPGYLQGGEAVRIVGMNPQGELAFTLPYVGLTNKVIIAEQENSAPFTLETLLLNPNQMQLSLVWRAAILCDKQLTKIQTIFISLTR